MMHQFLRVLKQIITTVGLKTRETYFLPILEAEVCYQGIIRAVFPLKVLDPALLLSF